MNFKSSGLRAGLDPSLKKLLSETCLVNFTATHRTVTLAVPNLAVFALLHSIQSLGLFPIFDFHTHSSLQQDVPQRDKLQSCQKGLIFATPLSCTTNYCCLKRT